MTGMIGVIDIGKTNAKFAVVDLNARREVAVRTRANAPLADRPYLHADVEGIWNFLCQVVAELNREHPLEGLSVTTHGASAVLVDETGGLALPMLDYEFPGPDELAADYDRVRPDFSQSFTPRLPGGLVLGRQLFWQARRFPEAFARTKWILTYPQYWSFRLTGKAVSEITSLGCHTDLWDFANGAFSSLVKGQGWLEKFPPLGNAFDDLGPIRPDLAERLGVRRDLPVYAGIHDSNASLLPHVMTHEPPFAVVSTGTWVIACAPGGDLGRLDPARDSFSNIDALGRHVPSARFMGGREYSELTGNGTVRVPDVVLERVLAEKRMLLPSAMRGTGPFPDRAAGWMPREPVGDPEAREAIVSFYLAMMTSVCLDLAGAGGDVIVEGPFARNVLYLEMLAAATGRPVLAQKSNSTGTSVGAALLSLGAGAAIELPVLERVAVRHEVTMADYAAVWRQAVG